MFNNIIKNYNIICDHNNINNCNNNNNIIISQGGAGHGQNGGEAELHPEESMCARIPDREMWEG